MTVDSITDFTAWDLRDHFSDIEAAYLWKVLQPPLRPDNWIGDKEHDPDIVLIMSFLHDAETDGLLRTCWVSSYRPYYSRQDLMRYAAFHCQFPPFLFPEYRQPHNTENTGSLPPPEKATEPDIPNNRSRQSVKKIIDALLSLHYGKDWLDGDIETCADEFINDLSHKGIDEPLERRTLINWFNQVAKHRRK